MNKVMAIVCMLFVGVVFLGLDSGCAAAFCTDGVECDGTCLAADSQCCDPSAGTYCNPGMTCGPDNTCLTAGENNVVNSAEGCLNQGLLPCLGPSGIGCIPPSGICCVGTGRYCQDNQTCGGGCGDECCFL